MAEKRWPLPDDPREFSTLVSIIARLREPQGCPWDRKQTHLSLRENLLMECYEALQALDEAEPAKLCEELGDLLLQIVLHARIAAEGAEFDIGDIIAAINRKLVRRHPHIFGSTRVKDADEVAANWEALKEEERAAGGSALDGVPKELPALAYGQEVQSRAARVGFDWDSDEGVVDKLAEEVDELRRAANQERRAEEFGDIIFTLVNIARRLDINAETELRKANRRFYGRFTHMEKSARARGLKMSELSLAELERLWEEAKRDERAT